jgi:predicted Rossmann fold flavoprotein
MKTYDVLIIGAGASGLMCAANLPKKLSVGIIETNKEPARKLKISGGGKCNITNRYVSEEHYDGDKAFVATVLKKFSRDDLLRYLERNRIELELRKGRYYFCKESSDAIIEQLLKDAKNADLLLQKRVEDVTKEGEYFCVHTTRERYCAKKLVVASGGESFKNIGASDIGLEIAKKFGVTYEKFSPALVGLTLQKEQFWMKELSGLSCYVAIKVGEKRVQEEMLFAHKGISGPAVLSASLYWRKGDISIDFLPKYSIEELLKNGSKKLLSSLLPLPKRLSKKLLQAIGIEDKAAHTLSPQEKELLKALHGYTFAPAGNFGFSKAEVSRGGVLSEMLDARTFETKRQKGLYFIGEVVAITGELGGYNFQWAFASAYLCAKALKSSFKEV